MRTRRQPGTRKTRLFAVSVVLLALLGVMAGCEDEPSGEIQSRHVVVEDPPEPLSAGGPPAAVYRAAWRQKLGPTLGEYAPSPLVTRTISGQVLVRTGDTVQAYGARSGRPTWRYREPGRGIYGLAITSGVVVVGTGRSEPKTRQQERTVHLVGLDAGTGRQLWDRVERWSLTTHGWYVSHTGGPTNPPGVSDAAGGTVTTWVYGTREDPQVAVVGIDARTGEERWRRTAEDFSDGCEPNVHRSGTSAKFLAAVFPCEDAGGGSADRLLAALDPATGEVRWARTLADRDRLEIADGITVWGSTGSERVLGRGGDVLMVNRTEKERCRPHPAGDRVAVFCTQPEHGSTVHIVDPGTGDLVDAFAFNGYSDPLVSPGRAYHIPLSRISSYAPVRLGVTELSSGHRTTAVLPASGGVPPTAEAVRVAATGGQRLFVTSKSPGGTLWLTAIEVRRKARQPQLGGLTPQDWPDPCALLPREPPSYPEADDPLELGEVTVPATECTVDGHTVRVDWVAASPKQADALLPGRSSNVAGIDEQYRGDPANDADDAIRVGSYILHVTRDLGDDRDRVLAAVARKASALQR